VAITVDDGSKNFIAAGYPVLQELRVPVTLYVSTYYVFKRLPVFNACASYLLWRGARARVSLAHQPWLEETVGLDQESWLTTFRGLLDWCGRHGLDADGKHGLLPGLAAEVGVDLGDLLARELFHLMSSAELSSLDPGLVDLQLHTHRHTMPADPGLAEREIRANREALSRCGRAGESLVDFCYPSGVYHPEQLGLLRALGIRSATTCEPGLASRSTDPLLLPRFIDNEMVSEAAFRCWLSGAGALLRKLRPS
jgi:peptidoglycan/xylan/chitin deacetylase (PgdA/CDA1 family)